MIINLSELHFISRRFTLFILTKELISIIYGSITSNRKSWGWVIPGLRRNTLIISNLNPLKKFILLWNISQRIMRITLISTRSLNSVMKRLTQPFILLRLIKWVPGISGDLVVKSKLPPRSGSSLGAVEPHPQKGAIKFIFKLDLYRKIMIEFTISPMQKEVP